MKASIRIFSSFALALLLFSCGHKHTATEITLDNGSKWTANPETTIGINNMIGLMDAFKAKEDTEAYKSLASSLGDEFQLIFKNCTMEGEAHNQLHNFLLPMKDLFDGFKSKELSVQKETFDKLKAYLMSYPEYFQ